MKKIFDWTAGSFFRTIGRVIAFSVIGYLIAMLLQANDFKLSELFFTKVSASTYKNSYFITYTTDSSWQTNFPDLSGGIVSYKSLTSSSSTSVVFNDTSFYIKNGINVSQYNGGYISFPFQMRLPIVTTTWTDTFEEEFCQRYKKTTVSGVEAWTCDNVSSNTNTSHDREYVTPQVIVVPILYYAVNNVNYWVTCDVHSDTNTIQCPIKSDMTMVNQLRISSYVYYSSSNTYTYYVNLGKNISVFTDGVNEIINAQNQNTEAITNQTQQQQQQHQEMMDSNTTEAEEEATGFFDDFEVPDAGGLSAIITAPLSTIQSLLNSTCSNLVLPLPFVNENLTLPCLNPIYTEHFGLFFTLYQTIILAIISYRCIRSIFFDIHGFTDPNDDRIEVMDL